MNDSRPTLGRLTILRSNDEDGEEGMMLRNCRYSPLHLWLLLLGIGLGGASWSLAQDDDRENPNLDGSQVEKIETADGALLIANYWKPKQGGSDTPIVVLLPELQREWDQREWFPIAKALHDDGMAVLTFDFRGFGASRSVDPERYWKQRRGSGESIDAANEFKRAKDYAILVDDLEAVKRFVLKENNARSVNAARMALVAPGELSAIVALDWLARKEYRFASSGFEKTGGDVQALVLVTPGINVGGYQAPNALGSQADQPAMLILGTKTGSAARPAEQTAKKYRVRDRDDTKARENYYRKDSVLVKVDTKKLGDSKEIRDLAGVGLLLRADPEETLDVIRGYLLARIAADPGPKWSERNLDFKRSEFGN